jgi:hypothetical protein
VKWPADPARGTRTGSNFDRAQSDRGFTKDRERLLEAQVAESSAPLATSSKKGMRRRLFHNGLATHPKFAPKASPKSNRWCEVWLKESLPIATYLMEPPADARGLGGLMRPAEEVVHKIEEAIRTQLVGFHRDLTGESVRAA